jgi:hypothetical protein
MWNIRSVPVYRLDISVTRAEKHAQSSSTGVTTAICLLIEDKNAPTTNRFNFAEFLNESIGAQDIN